MGKVFVVYDDSGAIRATAASAHPQAQVAAKGGEHVYEMELPAMVGDALKGHLLDLHLKHRVELGDPPTVVRK